MRLQSPSVGRRLRPATARGGSWILDAAVAVCMMIRVRGVGGLALVPLVRAARKGKKARGGQDELDPATRAPTTLS